jgi:hypothetical protein
MSPVTLQIPTDERRKNKMFGQMQVIRMFQLSKLETVEEAVAKLLEFAEYPKIFRWFQFPTALLVLLALDDAPDCGAIYVYDRKRSTWLWVDFDDRNYGGYSPSEFDLLLNQCHFFGLVESPALLESPVQWLVSPGQRPTVLGRLSA